MKISNEILSNKTVNFEENSKPYTTRALFRTKKLSLKCEYQNKNHSDAFNKFRKIKEKF